MLKSFSQNRDSLKLLLSATNICIETKKMDKFLASTIIFIGLNNKRKIVLNFISLKKRFQDALFSFQNF